MIRIGTVWDRTVDVVRGRMGIIAGLTLLYILLPNIVSAAFRSFMPMVGGLTGIAASLLLVFGVLAITAVASDPAVDRAAATRIAAQRFGAMLGILAIMVVTIAIVFLPALILLLSSGATIDAAGKLNIEAASSGALALSGLLMAVALAVGIWVSARLVPLFAVIVNERLGLGALRRSFALTRGSTMKLIGVILLYAVVLVVVMAATTSVVGVVARLLLGGEADAIVVFVIAVVTAIVTAGATVLQTVFYTQFYVAARDAGAPGVHPGA